MPHGIVLPATALPSMLFAPNIKASPLTLDDLPGLFFTPLQDFCFFSCFAPAGITHTGDSVAESQRILQWFWGYKCSSSHSLCLSPYGCYVTQDCTSLLVSAWKTSTCKRWDLMETGFRAILVDTSGVDKQWDGSKLPTPVKAGGTLCCTAGGAISQRLQAPNPAQLPAARPCLMTARTALICCFTSFISSHFHFTKEKYIPECTGQ